VSVNPHPEGGTIPIVVLALQLEHMGRRQVVEHRRALRRLRIHAFLLADRGAPRIDVAGPAVSILLGRSVLVVTD
jgi:hypothetical protein